jgi:UDP-glucose 4-epimerase
MNPDWVIGGGGLLGSAIRRAVTHTWATHVRWDDADTAEADLRHAVDAFVAQPGQLRIYWCAGKGVTATPAAELAREITTFHTFLDALRGQDAARTTVFLASSVGGAYAAASAPPFTERTSARAASAYGEAKLDMERSLSAWTESTGGRAVIGRITNLYGPGQDVAKAQGLISVALRSYLTGAPSTIFVSLDTLRDYLFVDDCAAIAVAAMRRAEAGEAGCATLKILGYGTAVSPGCVEPALRSCSPAVGR